MISDSGEIQAHQEVVFQKPGIAFYFELGGKGFYSLNIDYRSNKSAALALGIQWIEDAFFPGFRYYRFRGKTSRTEIGGGVSGVFTKKDGWAGVAIHGDFGYRYQ